MIILQTSFKYYIRQKVFMKMECEEKWNMQIEAMRNINTCNY